MSDIQRNAVGCRHSLLCRKPAVNERSPQSSPVSHVQYYRPRHKTERVHNDLLFSSQSREPEASNRSFDDTVGLIRWDEYIIFEFDTIFQKDGDATRKEVQIGQGEGDAIDLLDPFPHFSRHLI